MSVDVKVRMHFAFLFVIAKEAPNRENWRTVLVELGTVYETEHCCRSDSDFAR
jgi:hypothetical protein